MKMKIKLYYIVVMMVFFFSDNDYLCYGNENEIYIYMLKWE